VNVPALHELSLLVGLGSFLALGGFLAFRWWRQGLDPAALPAVAATAVWLGGALGFPGSLVATALELITYGAWLWLLVRVLGIRAGVLREGGYRGQVALTIAAVAAAAALLSAFIVFGTTAHLIQSLVYLGIMGKATLCLVGLVLVEQVVRNTRRGYQWNLKFLSLALATLFGYGFVLYGEALLFNRVNAALSAPQGLVFAMVAPMIAVAVRRNTDSALRVSVSQELVFRVGVLVAAGLYLMVLAAAGTYVQAVGGNWGEALGVVLMVLGAVTLVIALASSRVRGHLRRWVQRHVYRNRFDYRDEWNRVTRELTQRGGADALGERAIHALAHVTQSTEGAFWRISPAGTLLPVARVKAEWHEPLSAATARRLEARFAADDAVVDLSEDRDVPSEVLALNKARFVMPLMLDEELFGIIVLAEARAPTRLGAEEQRLLQLIAREVAGFLALRQADDELAASRSLRIMDKLSAFVVHDLKNVTGQLDLLLANAEKHRDNPAFIDDLLATAESASQRLTALLGKLRDPAAVAAPECLELSSLVAGTVERHTDRKPYPTLVSTSDAVWVRASAEPLTAAVNHLLDNAREAAGADGRVAVGISHDGGWAAVTVEDNGCGMSADFVARELFAPFATTKGRSGIGIGAYQARELVRELGGEITVASKPGHGSHFTLHIPAVPAGEQMEETPHGSSATAHH